MRSTRKLITEFVRRYLLEASRLSGNDAALYDWVYEQVQNAVEAGKIKSDEKSQAAELVKRMSLYAERYLARGSGRYVFLLKDTDQVMKLALNASGFAQNGTEAMIGIDPSFSDVVNPVTAMSKVKKYDGWLWITQKMLTPLSVSNDSSDWKLFKSKLRQAIKPSAEDNAKTKAAEPPPKAEEPGTAVAIPKAAAEKRQQEREQASSMFVSEPFKNLPEDFFDRIKSLMDKYKSSMTGDLYKPDSWAIDDGRLKLVDYGLTSGIDEKFYQSLEVDEKDKEGKKKTALFYGGEAQAQRSMAAEKEKSVQTKTERLNANAVAAGDKSLSPKDALLRLLRDVIPGLPEKSSQERLMPVPTDQVIRDRQDDIESMISQLTNPELKDKLYSGLEDYLVATGSLKNK